MTAISYAGGPSIHEIKSRVKADNIYKLSSNESPLGPSSAVTVAVQEAAGTLNSYPPRKDDQFCEALAEFHGRGLTTDHFVSAAGGVEVIDLLCQAYLQPTQEAIICTPAFGWYVRAVQRQQGEVVAVPLDGDTFAHNIEAILAAVTDQTRLLFLCNPHNPTGVMTTAADMQYLLDALPPHVILIADEVYYQFVERDEYPDSLQYVLDGRNIVIIHSFSKAYGLAGLRLGYGIGKPALIKPLKGLKRPFHQNTLLLAAGTAALADTDHLTKTVQVVREGKQYVCQQLTALGISFWPSEANFVLIRPTADAQWVADQLLERGIMVRPTDGNGLPGYLRVSIGLPEANEAFITALTSILRE